MKYLTILSVGLLFLTSCSSKTVFEKFNKQKNNNWLRFENQVFDIPIEKAGEVIAITFKMRVTKDIPCADFPIYATLQTPSGETRYMEKRIIIKNGIEFAAQPFGDGIYEATANLWQELTTTQKGVYKLKIESISTKYDNPGIAEVGVVVRRR